MSFNKKFSNCLRIVEKIEDREITCFVFRKNVKYTRLEFRENCLHLIVPYWFFDFRKIIEKKRKWILKKIEMIEKYLDDEKENLEKFILFGKPFDLKDFNFDQNNENKTIKFLKNILLEKIEKIAKEYSEKLGVKYNKIIIRKQKTKWGSCSSKGNLSFNIKAISLPENLLRYLVYHEVAHLIEKNHGNGFISLIKKEFPDYEILEKELEKYWIVFNANIWWKKII